MTITSNQDSWSLWQLDDFSSSEMNPSAMFEKQLKEIELLKQQLIIQQAEIESTKTKLFEEAKEQGFKEGFEKGFHEGKETGLVEGKSEAYNAELSVQKSHTEKLTTLIRQYESFVDDINQQLPQKILYIALASAQKLYGNERDELRDLLSEKINDELELMPLAPKHLTLRINPEDWPFIEQSIKSIFQQNNWKMIKDDSLLSGGFCIETDIQEIDATLEIRWSEIINLAKASLLNDK